MWIRIFPDVAFTKLGLEMPMGTGKGDVDIYTAAVRKWRVMFELMGIPKEAAKEALIKASKKYPVKVVKGNSKAYYRLKKQARARAN